MSSPNPRFPQSLIRIIRDFLFGDVRRALIQAGIQVVQQMHDSASRRLITTERQINMAFTDGDYPRARDRVVHIALLGGRCVALLVAIRALDKMKEALRRI